jgi:uncharacterized membrane protein (DUF4010 family)
LLPELNSQFPYKDIAAKVAVAMAAGLLVGLEREWAQKEVGVRTFAITALLGALSSLVSPLLVMGALVGVFLVVVFLNLQTLLKDRSLELTTSISLIAVLILGALAGEGHYFTAATASVLMTMLLAWKVELSRFADQLKTEEIRGAVLLGLLSFVIYPLLPDRFVDPWALVNPRQAWVIVVVIAGIGFVNYVLLRLYSTRGLYYAALLGGLVNSTAAAAELSAAFAGQGQLVSEATAVLLLTNVAMFLRNLVILAIFARFAVVSAAPALVVMALASALLSMVRPRRADAPENLMRLSSPVSLPRVLKFAALFLLISVIGTLAQRRFGGLGFMVVSVLGGLVSSASTTASAAALASSGAISPLSAGIATVLTSMSSALVNLPLVYQQTRQARLTSSFAHRTIGIIVVGLLAIAVQYLARR